MGGAEWRDRRGSVERSGDAAHRGARRRHRRRQRAAPGADRGRVQGVRRSHHRPRGEARRGRTVGARARHRASADGRVPASRPRFRRDGDRPAHVAQHEGGDPDVRRHGIRASAGERFSASRVPSWLWGIGWCLQNRSLVSGHRSLGTARDQRPETSDLFVPQRLHRVDSARAHRWNEPRAKGDGRDRRRGERYDERVVPL